MKKILLLVATAFLYVTIASHVDAKVNYESSDGRMWRNVTYVTVYSASPNFLNDRVEEMLDRMRDSEEEYNILTIIRLNDKSVLIVYR